MNYQEFLASKHCRAPKLGIDVPVESLCERLYPWQQQVVQWALKVGRAALFEDCGLGKTIQQLEWSRQIWKATGEKVLILCPLAVQWQTLREAAAFGLDMPIRIVGSKEEVTEGISIANYEKLHLLDAGVFGGVVLDEASILKSYTGTTKRALVAQFAQTRFKLACTATPAPNDRMELGNQAEFLGVMPSNEMLSRWFVNDGSAVGSYRLRKHGANDFWRWVASWAVCIGTPADIGHDDTAYRLPPLNLHEHVVDSPIPPGHLFLTDSAVSATQVHQVKRGCLGDRADIVAGLVNPDSDAWVIWCDTDYEADALLARIPGACEVRGSQPHAMKEDRLRAFSEGQERVMVTKPEIGGLGLNWQHCHKTTWFVGYSYERWYQAIRRMWRFGQKHQVEVHSVRSEIEASIVESVRKKQALHEEMQREMAALMREGMSEELGFARQLERYMPTVPMELPPWLTNKRATCQSA